VAGLSVTLAQAGPIPLDVSFACAPGEVLALVGPSGSGKSTVLRAIAGSYRVAAGRIVVNGNVWYDAASNRFVAAHRRSVGMVFQSYALFPHMTAIGNVMAAMPHIPTSERAARARGLLELLHLGGFDQRRPAELSGGQQQRVAVARALAREPEVLLLDEPFSAVDRATRQGLYREIAELRRMLNMPVVLVTHDLDEALRLADTMTVLHRGRTLQTGAPAAVTMRPASVEVAHLVDLRNLFPARVTCARPDDIEIDWAGFPLHAAGNANVAAGTAITWTIPDGYVTVETRGANAPRDVNAVPCVIDGIVPIGASVQAMLRPDHVPDAVLYCAVPIHTARQPWFVPGALVHAVLSRDGMHVILDSGFPSAALHATVAHETENEAVDDERNDDRSKRMRYD
jgi:molybdate transport system ATP-binding protein